MTKKTVEIKYYIEVEYDENSAEFQTALDYYRKSINENGYAEQMVLNAAYKVHVSGANSLLEGIGYVKMNGRIEDETMYCGIEIDNDDPSPEVDFY